MLRTSSVADEAGDFPVVTLIGVVDLHARNEIVESHEVLTGLVNVPHVSVDVGRARDVESAGGRRARPCEGDGSRGARQDVD